ncbi:MAG: sulfotransferase [Gemmatimonadetes bacterium]|nr:sulfotransferase [Gemmatimonadota bacterium]
MSLIMISAMYENGGNTTHRMLDGHPELFVYPFESQVGTGAVSDYLTSFVPIRYRWPEFGLDGTPDQDYEAFWDEELKTYLRVRSRSKFRDCGLEMDEADRKREFAGYLAGKPRSRRNIVLAYYHSTFATWRNLNRSGKERFFVGYNPVQVLDVAKFFADFPDGHMLHVVRHPFGGYADTKKRPFPISLERYGWTWNHCQHMALVAAGQYPGKFHILRFEDLVAGPRRALEPILTKMGLGWSDICLAPTFNAQSMGEIAPWGTIKTPTTAANLATRTELSPDEQARMAGLTKVMFDLIYPDDVAGRGTAR